MTDQELRDMRIRIQMAANVTIPRDQFIEILDYIDDLQARVIAATNGEPLCRCSRCTGVQD